jgi:methionyl-tRNA formyltransferase
MSYIIITKKKWDTNNYKILNKKIKILKEINIKKINYINPKIVFFIHWSKLIPKDLYERYTCIQFHISDLPRGRGGSPIQNQILRNIKKTKISAFKVEKGLDSGPICMKQDILLDGSAELILKNMEFKSLNMIKKLVKQKVIKFKKQKQKLKIFKRRKPHESEIDPSKIKTINKMYDFLRMLDAPNYPNAFIKLKGFKIVFNHIKKKNNIIDAKVKITKK